MAEGDTSEDRVLVIGDKAWSSWSLRPWLAAKVAGIPFREVEIGLRRPETAAEIALHSPSGRVPVLKHGDMIIWDSLAICEYLAELAPDAGLWPANAEARAMARSLSAEMHSGFYALRQEFPMDFHARISDREPSDKARADIARVVALWRTARSRYGEGGDFLFGPFTIADAMYAPVASRFRTYHVDLRAFGDEDGVASAYAQTLLAMPEMAEWGEGVKA
jgi:glutathione S-transferase